MNLVGYCFGKTNHGFTVVLQSGGTDGTAETFISAYPSSGPPGSSLLPLRGHDYKSQTDVGARDQSTRASVEQSKH